MKAGVYVALDHRKNPQVATTPLVQLAPIPDLDRLELLNLGSTEGNVLEAIPDEDPDFVDTDDRVVLPFPDGNIELLWATRERVRDLDQFTSSVDDFPTGHEPSDAELQAKLSVYFTAGVA